MLLVKVIALKKTKRLETINGKFSITLSFEVYLNAPFLKLKKFHSKDNLCFIKSFQIFNLFYNKIILKKCHCFVAMVIKCSFLNSYLELISFEISYVISLRKFFLPPKTEFY